jgi:hypothetical protein
LDITESAKEIASAGYRGPAVRGRAGTRRGSDFQKNGDPVTTKERLFVDQHIVGDKQVLRSTLERLAADVAGWRQR